MPLVHKKLSLSEFVSVTDDPSNPITLDHGYVDITQNDEPLCFDYQLEYSEAIGVVHVHSKIKMYIKSSERNFHYQYEGNRALGPLFWYNHGHIFDNIVENLTDHQTKFPDKLKRDFAMQCSGQVETSIDFLDANHSVIHAIPVDTLLGLHQNLSETFTAPIVSNHIIASVEDIKNPRNFHHFYSNDSKGKHPQHKDYEEVWQTTANVIITKFNVESATIIVDLSLVETTMSPKVKSFVDRLQASTSVWIPQISKDPFQIDELDEMMLKLNWPETQGKMFQTAEKWGDKDHVASAVFQSGAPPHFIHQFSYPIFDDKGKEMIHKYNSSIDRSQLATIRIKIPRNKIPKGQTWRFHQEGFSISKPIMYPQDSSPAPFVLFGFVILLMSTIAVFFIFHARS